MDFVQRFERALSGGGRRVGRPKEEAVPKRETALYLLTAIVTVALATALASVSMAVLAGLGVIA